DLIPPISSSCTADPFTSDGSDCPGKAEGTPFFLFTDGKQGKQKLFAQAYAPGTVTTDPATGVSSSGATLNASVDPGGAVVKVQSQFGTSTAYGDTTKAVEIGPATTVQSVAAAVNGLASGTQFHFRVKVTTDFGTFKGADRTFTTS